jgi:23S rRNA pseudouridine2605 synthase
MAESQPTSAHLDSGNLERLQKIIAAAGVCSRRKAEELIAEGRVQVNGQTVTELGTKADAARDHIRVDGKLLQGGERHRYYLVNKPKGYVTTVSDPENRPTVMQIIQKGKRGGERVFPVGRLDYASEGLQLLTNDGELANALTRASSKVEKTYLVKVSGKPAESALEQIRSGMMIEKGRLGEREGRVLTAPARIRMIRDAENPWYEMILIEGRNREIRKMFEEIGHHVEKIRRVGYGPLILNVEPGEFRELSDDEVEKLKRASRATKAKKPAKIPERVAKRDEAAPVVRIKKGPGGRPSSPVRRRAAKKTRPGFKARPK